MIKVYIPGPFNIPIQRQFPNPEKNVWGNCEFVFSEDDNYDYIVVIDSIKEEINTHCPIERRLLFLGEPPYVKIYNENFIEQFGHVYGCQEQLIRRGASETSIPLLPWMLGCQLQKNTHICNSDKYYTYSDFENDRIEYSRLNKFCLITSNKTFTKGHRDRVRFAERILKEYPDLVDIYGNGYNSISDKLDILSQYKYSIVIENCSYPNYWTEKLSDCFMAGCYPLYYGCTNINDYFSRSSLDVINILDFDSTISQLKAILSSFRYEDSIGAIMEAKKKVMNKYNMFSIVSHIIEDMDSSLIFKKEYSSIIRPMRYSIKDKIIQKVAWRFNIVL